MTWMQRRNGVFKIDIEPLIADMLAASQGARRDASRVREFTPASRKLALKPRSYLVIQ
jgi:hypothetical protein